MHVAATAWLYTQADARAYALRRPLRYVWIPAGLILAGAVTAALLSPTAMAWLLLPYFGWQFFHFQKQNLGMAALAASARSVSPLRPVERRALLAAGGSGIIGLVARPGLLQLGVRPGTGDLFPVAVLLFVGLVFGAYPGAVMAHFVIDAGFWRMRDPFPRMFMAGHVPYLVWPRAVIPAADGSPGDIR